MKPNFKFTYSSNRHLGMAEDTRMAILCGLGTAATVVVFVWSLAYQYGVVA